MSRNSSGASKRGIQRERDRVNWYRAEGWFALRAPASLGPVDVVAAKDGRLVFEEIKSTTAGAWHSFGPKDRAELSAMARVAGAEAFLVWHPPHSKPTVFPEEDWPNAR